MGSRLLFEAALSSKSRTPLRAFLPRSTSRGYRLFSFSPAASLPFGMAGDYSGNGGPSPHRSGKGRHRNGHNNNNNKGVGLGVGAAVWRVRSASPSSLSLSNPGGSLQLSSSPSLLAARPFATARHVATTWDDEEIGDVEPPLARQPKRKKKASLPPPPPPSQRKASAAVGKDDSEDELDDDDEEFDEDFDVDADIDSILNFDSEDDDDDDEVVLRAGEVKPKAKGKNTKTFLPSESEDDDEDEDMNVPTPARTKASSAKRSTKDDRLHSAPKNCSNGASTPMETESVVESSLLTESRFDQFNLSPLSIKALHQVLKYELMTPVQEATLPVILEGKDVLAKARTGTGKTIAFLLPAIEMISKTVRSHKGLENSIFALIVCPTRELALQAAAEATTLLRFHAGVGAQVVIGGNPIAREQRALSRDPCQILVATPGRLVDHLERTPNFSRQLTSVKIFVLDEADHMLDMGFRKSLDTIMEGLPSKRQTLLFSATIPEEVHNVSKIALKKDRVFIDAVGKDSQDTHAKVNQQCLIASMEDHLGLLYTKLQEHMKEDPQYKVLAFCTTARVTEFMSKLFGKAGFNTREIHSRRSQSQRTQVSDEFRKSKGGIILFTSDVSARGVDYPNVTLVLQIGIPSEREQYIHRLGRTGRAGKEGEGLLILAPWESKFLQKVKDLPITQVNPHKVDKQVENKIRLCAESLDEKVRTSAYQAWIGYYKSVKGLSLDKETLVHHANVFSSTIGFNEPPRLPKNLVAKMGLQGVSGLRLSEDTQNFSGRSRGGGYPSKSQGSAKRSDFPARKRQF